jgi:hypothetical protein
MKASDIRILKALDPGESYVEPTFVLVETTVDGDGDGETLTTIEHVASAFVGGKMRWKIVTLGQSVPLTHAGALEWAVSFAASRDIPVVYQRDESTRAYAAASKARSSAAHPSAAK